MNTRFLDTDVLTAAKDRIAKTFDDFARICVSFSGGKDSTVMLHLVCEEARKRKRRVGVLFIDWEVQYRLTVEHVEAMFEEYRDCIEPYWVALPILSENACSQVEPSWISWDRSKRSAWVRNPPGNAITEDNNPFDFWYYGMDFYEFIDSFGEWFSKGEQTAVTVGIRTRESLNRWRTIAGTPKPVFKGRHYTTKATEHVWNVYPIYDWHAEDDWTYFSKYAKRYNPIYDLFYQAGLSVHGMRVDEPYGTEARRGIWLYQILEPELWAKMLLRVEGAGNAAIYCKTKGNVLGNGSVELPKGHTWESFARFILGTMPPKTAEHYRNKIAVYIHFYQSKKGYESIPDFADPNVEKLGDVPSWRKICKCLLRNDYWCKSLGFAPTKMASYRKYCERISEKRKEWQLGL